MISRTEQQFLDALSALAAERGMSFQMPEGHAYLESISSYEEGGCGWRSVGRWMEVKFTWIPARQGDRYYDVDSTATDVRQRAELPGPLALIGAGVDELANKEHPGA